MPNRQAHCLSAFEFTRRGHNQRHRPTTVTITLSGLPMTIPMTILNDCGAGTFGNFSNFNKVRTLMNFDRSCLS